MGLMMLAMRVLLLRRWWLVGMAWHRQWLRTRICPGHRQRQRPIEIRRPTESPRLPLQTCRCRFSSRQAHSLTGTHTRTSLTSRMRSKSRSCRPLGITAWRAAWQERKPRSQQRGRLQARARLQPTATRQSSAALMAEAPALDRVGTLTRSRPALPRPARAACLADTQRIGAHRGSIASAMAHWRSPCRTPCTLTLLGTRWRSHRPRLRPPHGSPRLVTSAASSSDKRKALSIGSVRSLLPRRGCDLARA
jgi:hypothetical protein